MQQIEIISGQWSDALREWRDARQVIFDCGLDKQASPQQFQRLGMAENALMDLARTLGS